MTNRFRMPSPCRSRRTTTTAFAAVTTSVLVVTLLVPGVRNWAALDYVSSIVAYFAALFSAVLIYVHWRSSGGPLGWLILGITALSVQALGVVAMRAADPTKVETHQGWIALSQVAVAIGMVALTILSAHRKLRRNPLLVGLVVGLVVVSARYALVQATPPMNLWSEAAPRLVIIAVDVAIIGCIWRLAAGPDWVRVRVVVAWTLLSAAWVVTYPASTNDLLNVVTVLANILGATILLAVAIALLRLTIVGTREEVRTARARLEKVEADVRVDAARLHEIRSTLAGLTSASQLIHQDDGVDDVRRRKIELMIDSEMKRLQRMLNDEPESTPSPVDVDEVIRPLVLRNQVRGFEVHWLPSGERVLARSDQVAEVISVLLENAYQHAAGAGAWVYTRRIDDVVEIVVADSGPGVDRSVRPRMFELGERSLASNGSGIGLNAAKKLTGELGGYLRLVDSPAALGATFVFGLPAEERP